MTRFTVLLAALLAVSSCEKAPEPSEVARKAAAKLLSEEKFEAAAVEYEKSLELKPTQDLKTWDRAAYARMKANQYDLAAATLEKSLAHRPDVPGKLEALRNIAGMYLQQANDLENAEKYFQRAVELDPKDVESMSWLAEISSRRGGARVQTAAADSGHLTRALERYDAVIALQPEKIDAYINKRIALAKYLEHLNLQKASILTDAESQKKDKEAWADLQQQAVDTQTRADELKAALDEVGKKIGELNKAKAAAGKK